ncbi:MAG: cobalamin B12-binding domain-containing protein [Candidatus Saliniplasma sp.]
MIDKEIYKEYVKKLIEGDKKGCIELVNSLLDQGVDVKELYVDLIQPSMYEVGELWEAGEISVADEHLATSINDRILTIIYPRIFSGEKTGKSAVIACASNEFHQLGGRIVADYFELLGWDGYFIGANTPINDLIEMLKEKRPDLLGLSIAMYSNVPDLLDTIEKVREEFSSMKILVGGQAFKSGGSEVLDEYEGVQYITSLDGLTEIIG